MELITWLVVLPLLAFGLLIAASSQKTARGERLTRLGFARRGTRFEGTWKGMALTLEPHADQLTFSVPLRPQPLSYDKLVRALGRGELLARLYAIEATATTDQLTGRWPRQLRASTLRARLDELAALATDLAAVPAAEALARHILDRTDEDPITVFAQMLSTYPDAPETLAVCRAELNAPRNPEPHGYGPTPPRRTYPAPSALSRRLGSVSLGARPKTRSHDAPSYRGRMAPSSNYVYPPKPPGHPTAPDVAMSPSSAPSLPRLPRAAPLLRSHIMTIELIASNSPWNDKTHSPRIESWDSVEVHARFDQPISHELGYVDKDVTLFWLDVLVGGAPVSRLDLNKVLPELQDEAKTFKNGRFRFPLCKLPDALSQTYHAAFAETLATYAPGVYPVTVDLWTDNDLQKGAALATLTFEFEVAAGSADHLKSIADQNRALGADTLDDAEAKTAAFKARWASDKPKAASTSTIRVKLAAKHGDVRVRLHTGPGASMPTTVSKHVTTDWHTLQVGSKIELLDNQDNRTNDLLTVLAGMDGQTLDVG